MIEIITYAKVDLPGSLWLKVVDADTGEHLRRVVEAHAIEGWVLFALESIPVDRRVRFEMEPGGEEAVGDLIRVLWDPDATIVTSRKISSDGPGLTVAGLIKALEQMPRHLPVHLHASFDGMCGSGPAVRVTLEVDAATGEPEVLIADAEMSR